MAPCELRAHLCRASDPSTPFRVTARGGQAVDEVEAPVVCITRTDPGWSTVHDLEPGLAILLPHFPNQRCWQITLNVPRAESRSPAGLLSPLLVGWMTRNAGPNAQGNRGSCDEK